MLRNFLFVSLVFTALNSYKVTAQLRPLSSQYLTNQFMINPAYVGVHKVLMTTASTRGQWIGIDGAPWTHTVSVNSSITDRFGVGAMLISDNYGINNNLESVAAVSYKINWLENTLSFGLQVGWQQHRIDYSKLNLEYADDPNVDFDATSFNETNVGVGVFYKNNRFYAGFSLPYIRNVTSANGTEIRRHYYISAGYLIDYSDFLKFKPAMLASIIEGGTVSVELNAQLIINDMVSLGVLLKDLDAFGFNINYVEGGYMRVGYAYEVAFGPLATASFGIHELIFSIDIALLKKQRIKTRYF